MNQTNGSDRFTNFAVHKGTLAELFFFNDWARDVLMNTAAGANDEQLDRPFEMGEGSLRATLQHLFGAEWLWLERWKGRSPPREEVPQAFANLGEMWNTWRKTAQERDAYLATLTPNDLEKDVTYTNTLGNTYTFKLGPMLLHVCNHGTHHRAQASNMLRHLGATPPELDVLGMFM